MVRRNEVPSTDTISVEIGTVGGSIHKVLLSEGATVADALLASNYPEDSEVRCSGEVYAGTDLVEDGDTLIILGASKPSGA
jgi:hypothetical protein